MNREKWLEDFLNLFNSNKEHQYEDAIKLKNKYIPRKLYRYRTFNKENYQHRRGEIVLGKLYLSHPKELNDPFEAYSHLESKNPSNYIRDKKIVEKEYAKILPPQIHLCIFESDDWYERLLDYIAENSLPKEKKDEAIRKLTLISQTSVEALNNDICDSVRKIVRIASFTTKPDNLPMWNNYTNGCSGICLEYNTVDLINIYHRKSMFPVNYVDKLPDVVSMLNTKHYSRESFFEYMAINKLLDWKYEDEWRLVYCVNCGDNGLHTTRKQPWDKGLLIDFIKPSKIIMGFNMVDDDKYEIIKIAKEVSIPVYRSKITPYGLDFNTQIL